jgi:hypothetical protein
LLDTVATPRFQAQRREHELSKHRSPARIEKQPRQQIHQRRGLKLRIGLLPAIKTLNQSTEIMDVQRHFADRKPGSGKNGLECWKNLSPLLSFRTGPSITEA